MAIIIHQTWKTYKRLLNYVRPHMGMFAIAILGTMAYSGIDASITYLLKPILDKGFVARDQVFLTQLVMLIPAVFLIRGVASFLSNYCMARVGRSVVQCLREQMFKHLMDLPADYYDKHSSGQILSKIVYNTAQVANACTDALTSFVQSVVLIIGLLTVMFIISWHLTLIFLIAGPLIALSIRIASIRLRKLNHSIQRSMGEISHVAEEAIEGYKLVKLFGSKKLENDKFHKAAARNRHGELKVVVTKTMSVGFVQLFGAFAFTGMIYYATGLTESHALTAGSVAAMLSAMVALLRPLKELTNVNAKIQRGLSGAESIFDLLDQEVEQDTGSYSLQRVQGKIEVNNVEFKYKMNSKRNILDGISCTIQPGQMVALVGRSGSGKTTLVNLLTRFYIPESGVISLDGVDVKDWQLESYRNQFSYVGQQVVLFNDTIANNIAYGSSQPVDETAIREAAEQAHAIEFIDKLPQGLDTEIGENGVRLSGGQRQRIAIARAILRDAPILVLDEATSSLDTDSEFAIQQALKRVTKNRTTIVIAHRLSTIEHADVIFVLSEGKIVEVGNHESLLAKGGEYAHLYGVQYAMTDANESGDSTEQANESEVYA